MLLLPRRINIITLSTALFTLSALSFLYFLQTARFSTISSLSLIGNSNGSSLQHSSLHDPIWSTDSFRAKFAYAQYATDLDYLCNTVINFVRLHRFAAQADKVLIYPRIWDHQKQSRQYTIIQKLRSKHPYIQLHPCHLLSTTKGDQTWSQSLTKFNAFDLTDYSRVLAFDSDSLVLNSMDHYFLAPPASVAVPRAYWLGRDRHDHNGDHKEMIKEEVLASHVMLIEPSTSIFQRILDEATRSGDFDMEVINTLFRDSAMVLPHRRLALLTGEFRSKDHTKYMIEAPGEKWDAHAELSRAYLVHFSDYPLPKPWRPYNEEEWNANMPTCDDSAKDQETADHLGCADRASWLSIYEDYNTERKNVCAGWMF